MYNNMNKKLIRLTESDLHKIVKESVKRVLRESTRPRRRFGLRESAEDADSQIIRASFTYNGRSFHYSCPINELDRNYDDESTAYFIVPIQRRKREDDFPFFEINIIRDVETGQLIPEGYVTIYESTEDVHPIEMIEDCTISIQ